MTRAALRQEKAQRRRQRLAAEKARKLEAAFLDRARKRQKVWKAWLQDPTLTPKRLTKVERAAFQEWQRRLEEAERRRVEAEKERAEREEREKERAEQERLYVVRWKRARPFQTLCWRAHERSNPVAIRRAQTLLALVPFEALVKSAQGRLSIERNLRLVDAFLTQPVAFWRLGEAFDLSENSARIIVHRMLKRAEDFLATKNAEVVEPPAVYDFFRDPEPSSKADFNEWDWVSP